MIKTKGCYPSNRLYAQFLIWTQCRIQMYQVRSKAQTHTSESRYANVLFFVNSFETVSSVNALWGDETDYVGTRTEGYNTKENPSIAEH